MKKFIEFILAIAGLISVPGALICFLIFIWWGGEVWFNLTMTFAAIGWFTWMTLDN